MAVDEHYTSFILMPGSPVSPLRLLVVREVNAKFSFCCSNWLDFNNVSYSLGSALCSFYE